MPKIVIVDIDSHFYKSSEGEDDDDIPANERRGWPIRRVCSDESAHFKVTSETHIWNVIKSQNGYLHIDVTWDDPTNNIFHTLSDKYLLIDTNTLLEYDQESHNFNKTIYLELNQ